MAKVAPSAVQVEEAILGLMMLNPDAVDTVLTALTPDCFYMEKNQTIYKSIQHLAQKSAHVDTISVMQELLKTHELDAIGGGHELNRLTDKVSSAVGIEGYCMIVLQKFMAREMIRVCGQILFDAYDPATDVFTLLDTAEQTLLGIAQNNLKGDMIRIDSVLMKTVKNIEERRMNDTTITGIPSGFPKLDEATRGWQAGDLIIIAARPSVGKTALALHLADHAADNSIKRFPVAVWSLEMGAESLVERMLSQKSEILLHRIQTGRLDDEQMKQLYQKGIQALHDLNIYFDENTGLTLNNLRAKARRLKKKHNLGLIIVDYMQLMSIGDDSRNREQEIAKISRGLKNLAKELKIPVIALSQLSRDIEKRSGFKKKPQLSDLRESGSIEQDADVVVFLWAPDEEEVAEDRSLSNVRYARIAKQRNGVLANIDLEFNNGIQKFKQREEQPKKIPEKEAKKLGLPGKNMLKIPALPYAEAEENPF